MVDLMRAKLTGAGNDHVVGTFSLLGWMKVMLYVMLEEKHGFSR